MQAVNSIRLVLGTVLDVSEDDELEPPELLDEPRVPPVRLPVVRARRLACGRSPALHDWASPAGPVEGREAAANVSVLSTG